MSEYGATQRVDPALTEIAVALERVQRTAERYATSAQRQEGVLQGLLDDLQELEMQLNEWRPVMELTVQEAWEELLEQLDHEPQQDMVVACLEVLLTGAHLGFYPEITFMTVEAEAEDEEQLYGEDAP